MILEIELGALLALNGFALLKRSAVSAAVPAAAAVLPPAAAPASPAPAMTPHHVEIVKRAGETWHAIGHRHHGHSDIAEALTTPGLAVRHADGRIEGIGC